jgi:hypothetical protein
VTEAVPVDLGYRPRQQQVAIHQALERHRWVVSVCHRRMGKTVAAIHHLVIAALSDTRPAARYGFVAPTYRQAKLIAWDVLRAASRHIPGVEQRDSDLIVNLPNGNRIQLFGGDNPDSLRGSYFMGCVLDEMGMHPADIFGVIRPMLADYAGWCLILGTPNGKNAFFDLAQRAMAGGGEDGAWQYLCFPASATGIIPESELADARALMSPEEYQQEFECSFEAAVRGAIYARELEAARTEGRIGAVPYDPMLKVSTAWDLGFGAKGDATAIWFYQRLRSQEVRLIDYVEAQGEGLPYYAKLLSQKPYVYDEHWGPHDIRVKESTGKTRIETARDLGLTFRIAPNVAVEDGIHSARMVLPRCYIDAVKCKEGLDALMHYQRDYNARLGEFKASPLHNWASHGADAFRYLAVSVKPVKETALDRPSNRFAQLTRITGDGAWLA